MLQGSLITVLLVAGLALLHLFLPEETPLPIPTQPYQGPWWQPVSVLEALIILALGLAIWGRYGGAHPRLSVKN